MHNTTSNAPTSNVHIFKILLHSAEESDSYGFETRMQEMPRWCARSASLICPPQAPRGKRVCDICICMGLLGIYDRAQTTCIEKLAYHHNTHQHVLSNYTTRITTILYRKVAVIVSSAVLKNLLGSTIIWFVYSRNEFVLKSPMLKDMIIYRRLIYRIVQVICLKFLVGIS